MSQIKCSFKIYVFNNEIGAKFLLLPFLVLIILPHITHFQNVTTKIMDESSHTITILKIIQKLRESVMIYTGTLTWMTSVKR